MKISLHVGHGKTGSSFIQSSLAHSIDILKAKGVYYPIDDLRRKAAIDDKITSGNLAPRRGQLEKLLERHGVDKDADGTLLISNESLFRNFFRNERIFEDVVRIFKIENIEILVFIRNPLDHAASSYGQSVKRDTNTGEFGDYLSTYDFPRQVGDFMRNADRRGLSVRVKNYSNTAEGIIPVVEKWLALPQNSLRLPNVQNINRSLTRSELKLKRLFNNYYGKSSSAFISDPLCHHLPTVKPETPTASARCLEEFSNRMTEDMEMANAFITPGERYTLGDTVKFLNPGTGETPDYTFTEEQLDLLVREISRWMKQGS